MSVRLTVKLQNLTCVFSTISVVGRSSLLDGEHKPKAETYLLTKDAPSAGHSSPGRYTSSTNGTSHNTSTICVYLCLPVRATRATPGSPTPLRSLSVAPLSFRYYEPAPILRPAIQLYATTNSIYSIIHENVLLDLSGVTSGMPSELPPRARYSAPPCLQGAPITALREKNAVFR